MLEIDEGGEVFVIDEEGVKVDEDNNTNYWMAIQDPNDESKTLGIMGI